MKTLRSTTHSPPPYCSEKGRGALRKDSIEAKKHKCACKIRIIPEEGASRPWANAKSIMMILGAGINNGHRVEVMCDGDDEDEALDALITLIDSKFGEA